MDVRRELIAIGVLLSLLIGILVMCSIPSLVDTQQAGLNSHSEVPGIIKLYSLRSDPTHIHKKHASDLISMVNPSTTISTAVEAIGTPSSYTVKNGSTIILKYRCSDTTANLTFIHGRLTADP